MSRVAFLAGAVSSVVFGAVVASFGTETALAVLVLAMMACATALIVIEELEYRRNG